MALFHDPEFWVLAGFVIFFGFLGKTFWKLLKGGLDARWAPRCASNSRKSPASGRRLSFA